MKSFSFIPYQSQGTNCYQNESTHVHPPKNFGGLLMFNLLYSAFICFVPYVLPFSFCSGVRAAIILASAVWLFPALISGCKVCIQYLVRYVQYYIVSDKTYRCTFATNPTLGATNLLDAADCNFKPCLPNCTKLCYCHVTPLVLDRSTST